MSLEKNNLKQEASAALATAVIAIPGTLIFGMIAFAPLGQRYISFGILSGFVCAIVLGGFSGFFSPTKGLISGPRAGVSIAIASFLTFLSEGSMSLSPSYLLWLLFLTLLTAGFFQLLLGLFKMGIVIKYISYPVIVGLINSKVFLLLKGQFWNIIGIEKESTTLWGAFQRINPYSALVFVFTLVLYFLLKKFMKKIPVHIFVIISGTLLHHMLLASGITTDAGNALPAFQMDFSNIFYYLENSGFLDFRFAANYVVEIIAAALGIAILSSTDTLLTSLAIQNITYDKVNGNRELLVQGLGNILTAFLGGIPGGGSFTRSMTNVHAGGRSRIAALGCAALLLLILTQLSEIIYYIPLSVIAGMVVLIAANMFDTWIIELFRKLWKRDGGFNALVLVNIAVVLLVFVITMITNLIYAALGGVIISMVLYVYRKSQSSILKKIYSGARIRSKKQRSTGMMELLSSHGHRIAIAELEGSIFFGTADELANQIDGLVKKEVKYIILDLKRITDIDASGVKILERVYNKSASRNCRMFFSYLSENSLFWEVFNEFSFFRGLGRVRLL